MEKYFKLKIAIPASGSKAKTFEKSSFFSKLTVKKATWKQVADVWIRALYAVYRSSYSMDSRSWRTNVTLNTGYYRHSSDPQSHYSTCFNGRDLNQKRWLKKVEIKIFTQQWANFISAKKKTFCQGCQSNCARLLLKTFIQVSLSLIF